MQNYRLDLCSEVLNLRTNELLEAFKYGRVMAEQWTTFMQKSSDIEAKKQTASVVTTLLEGVPDLLTNDIYLL